MKVGLIMNSFLFNVDDGGIMNKVIKLKQQWLLNYLMIDRFEIDTASKSGVMIRGHIIEDFMAIKSSMENRGRYIQALLIKNDQELERNLKLIKLVDTCLNSSYLDDYITDVNSYHITINEILFSMIHYRADIDSTTKKINTYISLFFELRWIDFVKLVNLY